jgi:hypothetical protein
MSLRIRGSEHARVVKTGYAFQVAYGGQTAGLRFEVQVHDLMLPFLGYYFYCPSTVRPVSRVIGFIGVPDSATDLKVSTRPEPFYDPNGTHDFLAYGSFLANLQLFASSLGAPALVAPSSEGEHAMRHVTYSGELSAKQTDFPTYTDSLNFYGTFVPCRNYHGMIYQFMTVNSVIPLDVTPYGWNGGGVVSFNILDFLDGLIGKEISNLSAVDGQLTNRVFSDLSYDLSDSGLAIRYRMRTFNLVDGVNCEWVSSVRVTFVDPPGDISPVVGGSYSSRYTGTCTFSFVGSILNTGQTDSDSQVGTGVYRSFPLYLSQATTSISGEWDQISRCHRSLSDNRFLIPFRDAVYQDFYDIATSSLFSTVDAFKMAEASLNTNVLQTLAKIPKIFDALPEIGKAVDLLGRLVKRDLRLSTFKEILDLATSTHLQAVFEWRPYYELLTRYIPQVLSTMDSIGDIRTNSIGYGSFSFKFTNEFGRKEVTLKTRTKIVMDASPSGLLSAAVGLDALGLLPKASNLWDLLPFTFVVNWFTGVGEAIRRAEYATFLASVPAYYVHTYTLSSPLSDDELDLLKMSSSISEPACLRIYVRDVTNRPPFPRDTRFGFGLPSGIPSVGSLGSLLYQLIFA